MNKTPNTTKADERTQAPDRIRRWRTKGELLECIAILADSRVINSKTEEQLQDKVETLF